MRPPDKPFANRLVAMPRFLAGGRSNVARSGGELLRKFTAVVLITRGTYQVNFAAVTLQGGAGDLFVLPRNMRHSIIAPAPRESIYIFFVQDSALLQETPRVFPSGGDAQLRGWIEELVTMSGSERNELDDPVADGLLFATLNRINEIEQRSAAEALHPALERAVRFIHQHVAETIDAPTVAAVACVSYAHLSLLFRSHFACGPLQFQQKLRMNKAARLLLNPVLTTKEIAAACGYDDVNYFVRLFTAHHRLPPGRWRRKSGIDRGGKM
jgi:AraC-like DNA-binding protein